MASALSITARQSFLKASVATYTSRESVAVTGCLSLSRFPICFSSFSGVKSNGVLHCDNVKPSSLRSNVRRGLQFLLFHAESPFSFPGSSIYLTSSTVRCMSNVGDEYKSNFPARLLQKQQLLDQKTDENQVVDDGPTPQITEEQVTVSFARSGGPGGQNVNKVNTKVDMRFNVMAATWLPERIRLKILEKEKNRINSEGELVVSSTRTRTQRGNLEDALQKIQTIIDAAAYVPPPPSEEKKKRINKLAKAENERRLKGKKELSSKKGDRRNKGSWD